MNQSLFLLLTNNANFKCYTCCSTGPYIHNIHTVQTGTFTSETNWHGVSTCSYFVGNFIGRWFSNLKGMDVSWGDGCIQISSEEQHMISNYNCGCIDMFNLHLLCKFTLATVLATDSLKGWCDLLGWMYCWPLVRYHTVYSYTASDPVRRIAYKIKLLPAVISSPQSRHHFPTFACTVVQALE